MSERLDSVVKGPLLRDDELSLTGSAKVKTNELRELAAKQLGAAASQTES